MANKTNKTKTKVTINSAECLGFGILHVEVPLASCWINNFKL